MQFRLMRWQFQSISRNAKSAQVNFIIIGVILSMIESGPQSQLTFSLYKGTSSLGATVNLVSQELELEL